jgi:DNA replication ATP-dependent helicase Dna2
VLPLDVEVTFGLLYYLETSKIMRIRGIRHELLHMIQERNRVAGYVRERTYLPPMLRKPSMCNRCYSKTACFIYHKLADDGNGETSGLGEEFDKAMEHLNPSHRDFFRKWDDLLTKEETSMMRFKRELWTLLSHEREALGRCFGNIVIEPGTACEDKDGTKINRYRYTFVKKQQSPTFSFAESQITVGEPIVISDEKGHFALANGYVVQISPKRVTVAVDRRLHNSRTKASGFDSILNQSFRGIMEIEGDTPPSESAEETLYRLDKDEFSNGMAIVRSNLIAMMEKDLFQAGQLRKLIVEGKPPAFKPNVPELSGLGMAGLNIDQKQAIKKVMSAQDYALVLGMPGTGKTTTIAHILRALVAQGKSVLLTSYTHTAVDNILLKVRDDNMRILRIGTVAKVHPEVHQFAELTATPKKTIAELKATYEDSQVVATTCLGVGHNIFTQRVFDYCIVDEASQITLPVCLGPIRMAKTFILVGDHYQLPPLVQNKEAQAGGLDVSLFKLLSDAHPSSVVNLEHQYRMCEDIMLLSNTLIYSGRLKCGTAEVAARSVEIPNIGGLKQHHLSDFSQTCNSRQLCLGTSQSRCWLRDLVDPLAKTYLVDTDTLGTPAGEVANGSRIVNPIEATLCTQLVEAFISCGIPARSIGVITFYRSQLSLLKQNLRHHLPALEMHTADKFQGRDKEVIILSCVRSNQENYVGDLLSDWRRVNVAFTRARTKLLVLGSKNTLRNGNELLSKYVDLVENQGWVYSLPKNAVENHIFDEVPLSTYDQSTPSLIKRGSPRKSPSVMKKTARNPLSPVQQRLFPTEPREPAKKGMKLLNGQKILGNRLVLQDVVNDLVG